MAPRRSLVERELVLQMHERRNLYSEISAVLGISRSTCHAIVQRFTMRGHLRDTPSRGRPRILDERDDREVIRLLNAPSNGIAATVGREMRSQGLDLSDDTVRRCLRRQGLRARVKTKKPFLSKKYKARRYTWAKKCRHASWMDWSYVIFSDESKFNLFGSNRRQYCWRKRGEHLLD
jgi:transposase